MIYDSTLTYVSLMPVLGASQATQDTIALFNSVRRVEEDKHGKFITIAVKAYKNGVLTRKKYLYRFMSKRVLMLREKTFRCQLISLYNGRKVSEYNVRLLKDIIRGKYDSNLSNNQLKNRLHVHQMNLKYYNEQIIKIVALQNNIQL